LVLEKANKLKIVSNRYTILYKKPKEPIKKKGKRDRRDSQTFIYTQEISPKRMTALTENRQWSNY